MKLDDKLSISVHGCAATYSNVVTASLVKS